MSDIDLDTELDAAIIAPRPRDSAGMAGEVGPSDGGQCDHPFLLEGICTHCGALLETPSKVEKSKVVRLGHIVEGLTASSQAAERVRREKTAEALQQRRLNLVLDLDHTLLNSTGDSRLALSIPERAQLLRILADEESKADGDKSKKSLFWFPNTQSEGMWTKLRPGVRKFLADASELFMVSINTLGSRHYAHMMAGLLDSEGKVFRKVLGKEDGIANSLKTLESNLDLDERATVILDDSPERWGPYSSLVIPIYRYHYFPSSSRDFKQHESRCHLLRKDDEREQGGPLDQAMQTMKRIHEEFFRLEDAGRRPTTKDIIRSCRKGVLEGEVICFTRVIPVNPHTRQREDPRKNQHWQLALSMGAKCTLELEPGVTIVVAGALGTDKVIKAEARGIPCVSPDWLKACSGSVAREDPVLYPPPAPRESRRG